MCQPPDDVVVTQTFQIRGVLDLDGPTSLGGGIGARGVVRRVVLWFLTVGFLDVNPLDRLFLSPSGG
jgi:hypothetical protein